MRQFLLFKPIQKLIFKHSQSEYFRLMSLVDYKIVK